AADGTSNVFLLSHKNLLTGKYSDPSCPQLTNNGLPNDCYWGTTDTLQVTSWNRYAAVVTGVTVLYFAPRQDVAAPIQSNNIDQLGFGSPHPGAMPTLYADGSVRTWSYTTAGSNG